MSEWKVLRVTGQTPTDLAKGMCSETLEQNDCLLVKNIIWAYNTIRECSIDEPITQAASKVMEKCSTGELQGYVAFHTLPNLWYSLRKVPEEQRRTWMEKICDCLKVVGASHVKANYLKDMIVVPEWMCWKRMVIN